MTMQLPLSPQQIEQVCQIAREAGTVIMQIYDRPKDHYTTKDDDSPLTQADLAAHHLLKLKLHEQFPATPLLSEEGVIPYEERKDRTTYRCIDPLDGTKEFLKRNGEFTVNIALIDQGVPVFGVVYAPVMETLYRAQREQGAWKVIDGQAEQLQTTPARPGEPIMIVVSRSHLNEATQNYIDQLSDDYPDQTQISAGSSLKLCRIAEGRAHLYPRLAPTMERDTAAAQIVATEAGARMVAYPSSQPLTYNKADLTNPQFIVTTLTE